MTALKELGVLWKARKIARAGSAATTKVERGVPKISHAEKQRQFENLDVLVL